jgi:hypothetical protein
MTKTTGKTGDTQGAGSEATALAQLLLPQRRDVSATGFLGEVSVNERG